MAIMAMDTAQKIKPYLSILLAAVILPAQSGEWTFEPNISLDETYSDNVTLTIADPTSSFVSQAIAGLDVDYKSQLAEINFSATKSYVFYSHDSDLNDDYRTLAVDGLLSLWENGPTLIATGSIANINRNNASNSLADLVSGDTIESQNYSVGVEYKVENLNYLVTSSLIYSVIENEDKIGNSEGYTASLNTANGNSARSLFWLIKSNFSERNQVSFTGGQDLYGQNYIVDTVIGLITPFNINPLVRIYDEDFKGNAQNNISSTPSIGPGLRWQVSPHLSLDMSYNFVKDEEISDDYAATTIRWEPSSRTSLEMGFSERFFGKSYDLDFSHKIKRLTNIVIYKEEINVFDRNNYQYESIGTFWCPVNDFSGAMSDCYAQEGQGGNVEDYQLTSFSGYKLLESNEFSLNKRFSWSTELALSRTTFTFKAGAYQREGLQSKILDENLDLSLTGKRRLSAKSDLTLAVGFRYSVFDKNNPEGSKQEDYYRSVSSTYTRNLAPSLSSNLSLQYLDRESNIDRYSYQEVRAIINITKDF